MLPQMANAEQRAQTAGRARLRNSKTVFLVGNIEPTMEWYNRFGFESEARRSNCAKESCRTQGRKVELGSPASDEGR